MDTKLAATWEDWAAAVADARDNHRPNPYSGPPKPTTGIRLTPWAFGECRPPAGPEGTD